jgi:hypothetical protein
MPIKSYLAYPKEGSGEVLAEKLAALPGCAVEPAENRELLILITDTPEEASDKALEERLLAIPELDGLALVAAYAEEEIG